MRLSTKGRYGLRAMLDLALNADEEAVSIKSISERQCISENYLEQIIATLKKLSMLRAREGQKVDTHCRNPQRTSPSVIS